MAVHQHHEELVEGISEQLQPILDKSPQAVYIYLDDTHKMCNKKMATLTGFGSVKEWVEAEAPLADVVEDDQQAVIDAYENASERMVASHLAVRVKNSKTGRVTKTEMIVVPVAYEGHIFTLHFLSKI